MDITDKVIDLHEKVSELRGMLVVLMQQVSSINKTFDDDKKRIDIIDVRVKELEDYRKRANTLINAIVVFFSKWQVWAMLFFVYASIDRDHLLLMIKQLLPA